jgi:hypothetical protein
VSGFFTVSKVAYDTFIDLASLRYPVPAIKALSSKVQVKGNELSTSKLSDIGGEKIYLGTILQC